MTTRMDTAEFRPIQENTTEAGDIIRLVYEALKAKGYDPIVQIVGYLISGDPTYITNYQQARIAICRLERDEIMEELVRHYLKGLDAK